MYNYMVSSDYSYLLKIICLHTVMWFQVFLSNTYNLCTIIWFQVTVFIQSQKVVYIVLWYQIFLSNLRKTNGFKIRF